VTLPVTPGLDALDDRVKLTAALSTHFDPLGVLGVHGAESLLDDDRIESIDALATVSEEIEVAGSGYRHWSMRPEARQHVLREMVTLPGFRTLLDSIDVPPEDLFATYLRDGLRGDDLSALIPAEGAPPVPRVDADLDGLLRAVRFLADLPAVQTETGDLERRVRRQIALTEADSALQAVAPKRLVGRERDYDALLDYGRTVLATDQDWVPTFVFVGPGGVGKSALVSTFVLDQRRAAAAPLIYLDFDRATLIDATPLDLTHEFARQLGLAEVSLDQSLTEFRERSRSLLGGQENLNIDTGGGASSAALRDLASLLSGWPRRMEPVTIVLDTFEEVAIRGVTPVRDVLQWVADLRNKVQLQQIHLVVCGREVIPDAPHLKAEDVTAMFNFKDRWQLADLDPDKAGELLVELGVEPELALRFPPVFGGNPLVLKLIQRFVTTNDPVEVQQFLADGEKSRVNAPAGEVGLRFVYERILNRIKKPRVKALAYPGVVLRRVTPELILEVLAPACGGRLDVSALADAKEVFDELANHVWLVNRIAPEAVVHRADLRRLLVPGLEHNADVDTRAIHRAAAAYYAARPASVAPDDAEIEEIYHRGFLDDLPDEMPQGQAENILRRLAGDVGFWPVHSRAMLKSLAGRYEQQTEAELASLGAAQQRIARGVRLGLDLASSDVGSAEFEEAQLDLLDDEDDASAAISDSRWKLLFDRGDFDFITESSRVLSAFDRYFAGDRPPGLSSSPTHNHPWYIALAILMVERGARPLFSQDALAAIESRWEEDRRYGAALAALAGDWHAHARIIASVRREIGPRFELSTVDDIIVCQAAASRGDLDDPSTTFQTFSFDHFRLSHIVAIATTARENAVADRVAKARDRYALQRPDTMELNGLRETLASAYFDLGDAKELRAAPTTLSFLYGAIRTIVGPLDRRSLFDVVSELEHRSVFWPVDLTAAALDSTFGATLTPSDLTGLIETADRCGLIVDLIDAASARAKTRLSLQLASGIRRIESLLFPFAAPRGGPPRSG
jgi:hypothetical protein